MMENVVCDVKEVFQAKYPLIAASAPRRFAAFTGFVGQVDGTGRGSAKEA